MRRPSPEISTTRAVGPGLLALLVFGVLAITDALAGGVGLAVMGPVLLWVAVDPLWRARGAQPAEAPEAVEAVEIESCLSEVDRLEFDLQEFETHRREVLHMGAILEEMVVSLAQRVNVSAHMVEEAATETTRHSEDSCERVRRAGQAAVGATARMLEMVREIQSVTASVNDINAQMGRSNEITLKAVEKARRTDGVVEGLQQAAGQIGAVVSVIQRLARQTNFLALNATIEAQRAGAAGEGFNVVAEEVKRLARETAGAADEISAQIGDVQGATTEVVEAISDITETIHSINGVMVSIRGAVDLQAHATAEINEHVQQAAEANQNIQDEVDGIQGALSSIMEKGSESLKATSVLKASSHELGVEVKQFLTHLRRTRAGNRRRFPRAILAVTGEGTWGGLTHPVEVKDLSRCGARLRSDASCVENETVTLNLPTVGRIRGQVVWTHNDMFGVDFESLYRRADLDALVEAEGGTWDVEDEDTRAPDPEVGVELFDAPKPEVSGALELW